MIIKIEEPDGPYSCIVDTGVMEVELSDVFLGVGFVTKEGNRLSVAMRDDGFEVLYRPKSDPDNADWVEFKGAS